jgi:hypothetical protein
VPVTDYHEQVRDAIADGLRAQSLGMNVETVDDVDAVEHLERPCAAVVCIGPEQVRPEMATNQRDGIGYACAVLYISTGTARGEKAEGPPSITAFRRNVRNRYHNTRLSGVDEVGWCEVSDMGPLLDDKPNLFQVLQTGLVVVAVGRFPRSYEA